MEIFETILFDILKNKERIGFFQMHFRLRRNCGSAHETLILTKVAYVYSFCNRTTTILHFKCSLIGGDLAPSLGGRTKISQTKISE